ncbi:MAG TPA: protein kinase, partial [Polyangiaceae bacterium]|nr:protein kinase [Polyangiaceae bacterium]
MGRPSSEPPAWLNEILAAKAPVSNVLSRPAPQRHVSGRAGVATIVHSGAPKPCPLGSQGGGLVDLMKIGREAPGRYVYLSPDGEQGAELGRGGIGRVLVAMDEHLGREVAIKELLEDAPAQGASDPELLTRFLAEARITGQLEHPNIVPVYELGRRADGRLYYTMRVVRGETLSAALSRARTLGERLALLNHFTGLCHAIAYAHSRGVVHRDIKPDNVMIGEFGETIVLDWGIAKLQGQPDMPGARQPRGVPQLDETSQGDLVGTPLFMSPEQARGEVDQIDEASDVWSLGVVLYLLLAGRPPFVGKSIEEVVARVIEGRPVPAQRVEPLAPSELCAVVERALSVDKAQRYPSVREFVGDIQAFMSGARVMAYDYSALELFRRFYRRHRAAALVGLVALFSLLVVATELQRRILTARDRALAAERTALDKEHAARQSLAEVFTERALNASAEGDVVGAELYAARALTSGERPDARGSVVSWTNRHWLARLSEDARFAGCTLLASSGRGEVACAHGRELLLWAPGGVVASWALPGVPARLALSADARTLLAALEDGRFVSYDTGSQQVRHQFRAESSVPAALALSEDGSRFVTTSDDGWVQLWETDTARSVARVQLSEPVSARAFAPNGAGILLGGRLGALTLWDPTSGERRMFEGHRGTVTALAFSRRGDWIASAGSDRTLSLWNASTTKRLAPALRDQGTVQSLAWSPDGTTLIFGSDDRMFGLLDVRHPQAVQRIRGHRGPVVLASFAGPNELITLGGQRGLLRWGYQPPALPRELSQKANVLAQAFVTPELLATAGLAQEGVCLWQIADERCKTRLPVRDGQIRALGVHTASGRLALGTSTGVLTVWNLATALPEHVLGGGNAQLRSVEFSADGRELLSSDSEGTAVLWDLGTGQSLQRYAAAAPLNDALLDPARGRVLLAARSGEIELWSRGGQRERSVPMHGEWIMDLAQHAASDRLATAAGDGNVAVWSLATLERRWIALAHEGRALSVDFSPDGELLASAGEDGLVQLWSVRRGEVVARLLHHRGAARSVRFAPDGKFLVSGGDDGSVRVWDLGRLGTSGEVLLGEAER